MKEPHAVRQEILDLIPSLRAFAYSLARNRNDADDLVQETLAKAIGNIHRFTPGTNLRAWLFTIQRNTFYTSCDKRRREPPMPVEEFDLGSQEAGQSWKLRLNLVHEALGELPAEQREALMLVGGAGLSYQETADICGCAIGTIKSRVSRGRAQLLAELDCESESEFFESWS